MARKQTRLSEAEKVKALKRHLLEKVPVSEICDQLGVAPSAFYTWQQKVFAHAEAALQADNKRNAKTDQQRRIELLEQRLRQREEALAELMSEHVALKKTIIGLA